MIEIDLGIVPGGPNDRGASEVRLLARRAHPYGTMIELVRAPVGLNPISVTRDLNQWRFALRAGRVDIPTTRTLEGELFATAFSRAVHQGVFRIPLPYAGTVALNMFDRHDRPDLTGAVNIYSHPEADLIVLDRVEGPHHWPLSGVVDDSRLFTDARYAAYAVMQLLGNPASSAVSLVTDVGSDEPRRITPVELEDVLAEEIARRIPDFPFPVEPPPENFRSQPFLR